tara:strand:- start:51 stop:482 length:432 start_codon:yes stop_codon:yes gene_type:complete
VGLRFKLDPTSGQAIFTKLLMALAVRFPDEIPAIKNMLPKLKQKGVELSIQPVRDKRTGGQQRYYRKMAMEFGKFTGNTPDEIHEIMLIRTYGSNQVETKFGVMNRPVQRSADQSKSSYSDLIETLIRESAEMGFIIPPPKPR